MMLLLNGMLLGFVVGVIAAWFALPQPRWTWRKHAHHPRCECPRWLEITSGVVLVLIGLYALSAFLAMYSSMHRW